MDCQRSTAIGNDQNGAPVEAWATIYTNLRCMVDLHMAGDPETFGQRAVDLTAKVYFPQLSNAAGNPSGALPDIRPRDRLVFGTWPDSSVCYLMEPKCLDELSSQVLLVLEAKARKPG